MPKFIDARNDLTIEEFKSLDDLYLRKLNKQNVNFSTILPFFGFYLDDFGSRFIYKVDPINNTPLIFYDGRRLHCSSNNYLFLKFAKFHIGYANFLSGLKNNKELENLPVTSEMMENYIMKKFYFCLNEQKKKTNPEELKKLSDFQLITNLCIKERLTVYNFLNNERKRRPKEIKSFINQQYLKILRDSPQKGEIENPKVNVKDVFEFYESKELSDNTIKL